MPENGTMEKPKTSKKLTQFKSIDRRKTTEPPDVSPDRKRAVEMAPLEIETVVDHKIPFTEKASREYAELPIVKGQRGIQPSQVQFLYDEIAGRRINWHAVTLVKCDYGDQTVRINGGHTSWATVRAYEHGKLKRAPVVREVHFRAHTEEQVRQLYLTYDVGLSRTHAHRLVMALMGKKCAEGLNPTTLTNLAAGYRYWRFTGEAFHRISPGELAQVIDDDHQKLFNKVGRFYQSVTQQTNVLARIKRQPVFAAMFETFNVAPEASAVFWASVTEGLDFQLGDARLVLHRYLANVVVRRHLASGVRRPVTHEEMYRQCIQAFNKWGEGAWVKVLVPPKMDKPRFPAKVPDPAVIKAK